MGACWFSVVLIILKVWYKRDDVAVWKIKVKEKYIYIYKKEINKGRQFVTTISSCTLRHFCNMFLFLSLLFYAFYPSINSLALILSIGICIYGSFMLYLVLPLGNCIDPNKRVLFQSHVTTSLASSNATHTHRSYENLKSWCFYTHVSCSVLHPTLNTYTY